MNLLTSLKAKALRAFFDHVVLKKPGYAVAAPQAFFDEERLIPTPAGEMRVLLHWPTAAKSAQGKLPVVMMIHGGGFLFGLPEHEAVFCRRLAQEVGCLVVNPDYARTPQHPFPKALHQCHGLLAWIADQAGTLGIDPERIAVGGHSAGGNLTAGVVALAKAKGYPKICFQVLDYPFLDAATPPAEKTFHIAKPLITPGLAALFNDCYVQHGQPLHDPWISPMFAEPADLRGQPPALVITAEQDLLRDEAEIYVDKLRAAGVPVRHELFAGVDHAFTHIGPKAAADAAWQLIHESLRQAFRGAATPPGRIVDSL